MSGKLKMIIATIITAALVSGIWAFIMYNRTKTITEKFEGEIAQLTSTLDALGPNVDCYTVTDEYVNHVDGDTTGQVIEENALQTISVPESLVGDTYITDPSKAIGRYFKVNVQPGTPLTSDLIMAEKYDDTLRDVDIVCDSWVVGMREGDYVDLNMTLPGGQDYIVLSHKRVQHIGSKTIKLYLDRDELSTYNGAIVDKYRQESGQVPVRLYLTKYVEPGVQAEATEFYAVPDAVRTAIMNDPNIVDKAESRMKAAFRPAIDGELNQYIDEQTTLKQQNQGISGGWSTWNSNLSSDYNEWKSDAAKDKKEDTYESSEDDIILEEDDSTDTTANADKSASKLQESVDNMETQATEETGSVEVEETQPTEQGTTTSSGTVGESQEAVEEPDTVG